MSVTIALLRAVNVGGTGKLPMAELKAMAISLGFRDVRTYVASGNLLFDTDLAEPVIKARLEERLALYIGKPVGVLVRSAAEMARVLADNPFSTEPGNRVVAIFLNEPPNADVLVDHRHLTNERIAVGRREIYIHYPDGMGTSRLVVPAAKTGTARNMNTVAGLVGLAG